MLNLLNETQKNKVEKEYATRRWAVILLFLTFLFGILAILMLPSYINFRFKQNELVEKNKEILDLIDKSKKTNTGATTTGQENIKALTSTTTPHLFTEVVLHLNKDKNQGISITNISYQNETISTIIIQGVAKTREDLVAFQKTLENDTYFFGVDLPISYIGPKTQNQFSIKLSLDKKNEITP